MEEIFERLDRCARDLGALKDRVAYIQSAEDPINIKLDALELAFRHERDNLSQAIAEIILIQNSYLKSRIATLEKAPK